MLSAAQNRQHAQQTCANLVDAHKTPRLARAVRRIARLQHRKTIPHRASTDVVPGTVAATTSGARNSSGSDTAATAGTEPQRAHATGRHTHHRMASLPTVPVNCLITNAIEAEEGHHLLACQLQGRPQLRHKHFAKPTHTCCVHAHDPYPYP